MCIETLKHLLSLLTIPLLVFLRGRCGKKKKERNKNHPPLCFSGLFSRLPCVNKELTFVLGESRWYMWMDARECVGCATAIDGHALCLWISLPSDRLANHSGTRRTANEEPPQWFTLGVERRRPQNFCERQSLIPETRGR